MKSYKAYSDGAYLKKEDVAPPQVWTITDVKEQTVTAPGKEPKDKVVLFFDGTQKVSFSTWRTVTRCTT